MFQSLHIAIGRAVYLPEFHRLHVAIGRAVFLPEFQPLPIAIGRAACLSVFESLHIAIGRTVICKCGKVPSYSDVCLCSRVSLLPSVGLLSAIVA